MCVSNWGTIVFLNDVPVRCWVRHGLRNDAGQLSLMMALFWLMKSYDWRRSTVAMAIVQSPIYCAAMAGK